MPIRYWIAGAVAFSVILGWNAFCIQRDNKLFKAYDARMEQIRQAENR